MIFYIVVFGVIILVTEIVAVISRVKRVRRAWYVLRTGDKYPDFAKLAESAGILGIQITKPEDLRPALSRALAHEGPALVEVTVNRQELAMPPSISADQVLGFSLYMIRAVLNGRGDEVVDLAKTNLFR